MFSLSAPYRFKWGISDTPSRRHAEVKADIKEKYGTDVYLFPPLPMLFARTTEQFLHRVMRRQRLTSKWASGTTGETEWHYGANIISAAFLWFIGPKIGLNVDAGYCFGVLICPIVWDAWLIVVFAWLMDVSVFLIGVYFLISNLI